MPAAVHSLRQYRAEKIHGTQVEETDVWAHTWLKPKGLAVALGSSEVPKEAHQYHPDSPILCDPAIYYQ